MLTAPSHHRLHVQAALGILRLDAFLEFAAPWTVIFGPSGSGKSSLLRAVCGLLEIGHVEFSARPAGDTPWIDIESPATRIATHRRKLGYAPQGAVLFPHLTVHENVGFALQNTPTDGAPRQIVDEALDLFALRSLAARRPRDLSGGERQRVNLARAFAVPAPRLMLLDEPFTGIDRATRDALLLLMRDRLAAAGIPAISVTHDIEEALLLDAEVVRLESGQVTAQGPAREVLAEEREQMLRTLEAKT